MILLNQSAKEPEQMKNKTILEKYCPICDLVVKTIFSYDECSATCSICRRKIIVPALKYRKLKQSM